jgi:Flp pilus assembly protein TadD
VAESRAKESLAAMPAQADAHQLLGVVLSRQKRYCDAKVHYAKALLARPRGPAADRIRTLLEEPEFTTCR